LTAETTDSNQSSIISGNEFRVAWWTAAGRDVLHYRYTIVSFFIKWTHVLVCKRVFCRQGHGSIL